MAMSTGVKVALGAGAVGAAVLFGPRLLAALKGTSTSAAASGPRGGVGTHTVTNPVTAPGASQNATVATISAVVPSLIQQTPAIISAFGKLFESGDDD